MKVKHRMTKRELDEWFEDYDAENPHVYKAFVKMATEVRSQGHCRYGASTIMERLRWESSVRDPSKKYKLPNVTKNRLGSRFARKLVAEDPSFRELFTRSKQKDVVVETELVT